MPGPKQEKSREPEETARGGSDIRQLSSSRDGTAERSEAALPYERALDEYKEIGINWRYWGEVRFKQLTLFLLVTGALATPAFSVGVRDFLDVRLSLAAVGVLVSISFLVLEERATWYRHAFMDCAKELERSYGWSEYLRTRNPWPIESDDLYRFLFAMVGGVWVGYGLYRVPLKTLQFSFKGVAALVAIIAGVTIFGIFRRYGRRFLKIASVAGAAPQEELLAKTARHVLHGSLQEEKQQNQ